MENGNLMFDDVTQRTRRRYEEHRGILLYYNYIKNLSIRDRQKSSP